jgi:Zn-dependent peptidase ImmA (M78 family)
VLPRAFAAELLVPADELCLQVAGEVSYEQIAGLAREFGVRDRVIKHQIENHHLALIGRNL